MKNLTEIIAHPCRLHGRISWTTHNLQDQFAQRPADSPSTLGDDLAQLMLQVSDFSAQSSSLPIQLQMPSTGGLSDKTVGQQAAYLADLAKTIESKGCIQS